MNLQEMGSRLLPCDLEHPFIFISYSSKDAKRVFKDALELQRRGYNIWIDDKNLKTRKKSWQKDALKAIENYNCVLILFYLSENSFSSDACYQELKKSRSKEARIMHRTREVPFTVVEVNPINNISELSSQTFENIIKSPLSNSKKEMAIQSMGLIMDEFIPEDNNKVRIKAIGNFPHRDYYYQSIENQLLNDNEFKKAKFTSKELYLRALESLKKENLSLTESLLKLAVKQNHIPSHLMLSYLYSTGQLKSDKPIEEIYKEIENRYGLKRLTWFFQGESLLNDNIEEALAFYLAAAESLKNKDGYDIGSTIWGQLGNKSQFIKTVSAALNHYPDSVFEDLLIGANRASDEVFESIFKS